MIEAETHYADSNGVSIAYQVHGEGELDLVFGISEGGPMSAPASSSATAGRKR